MRFITDFADQALILPLAAAVAMALLLQGWRRGAAAWVVAIGATFAAMVALKLVFLACSTKLGADDIRSPSGHVAAATIVVGGLAALFGARRAIMLALAIGAGLVIGTSRLALGLHSLAEVVVGLLVGLCGVWILRRLAGQPPRNLDARRITIAAAVVVAAFHGLHLPAEAHIRSAALRFARVLAVCQSEEVRL